MAKSRLTRNLTLVLLLAGGAVAYNAYADRDVSVDTYRDEASCTASGLHSPQECAQAFATAKAEHEQSRPEFARREDCEADYGAAQCQPTQSGSFAPLFWGFMMGRMMGGGGLFGGGLFGGGNQGMMSQPVYGGNGRNMFTAGGAAMPFGANTVGRSTFEEKRDRHSTYVPVGGSAVRRGGFGTTGRSMAIHS